jgi:hypothetical protein
MSGASLADEFAEFHGILRVHTSRVIDNHIWSCRLQSPQKRAEMMIVRTRQINEYGLSRRSPAESAEGFHIGAAEYSVRKLTRLTPTSGFSTYYDAWQANTIVRKIAYHE